MIGLCAVVTVGAARASDRAAPPPGTDFRPAPQSTLLTRSDLPFLVARWHADGITTTLLALRQPGAEPRPVARLQQQGQGVDLQVSVQRLALPSNADGAADIELAALEHLYGLVFRQQPLATYCLSERAGPCNVAHVGQSHGSVLQALAAERTQAAARAASGSQARTPVPWQVVELQGAESPAGDVDTVSVRATGPSGPVERLAIHFDRAPHSICTARSGFSGQATCRLEDQHGDGSQHDHGSAVVAAFPGEVRPDLVLLPTTVVLATTPGRLLTPFARPPSWPLQPQR